MTDLQTKSFLYCIDLLKINIPILPRTSTYRCRNDNWQGEEEERGDEDD